MRDPQALDERIDEHSLIGPLERLHEAKRAAERLAWRATVAKNERMLRRFEDKAEALLAANDADGAMNLAALGAEVAWWRPPERLFSTRLESVIGRVARGIPRESDESACVHPRGKEAILHVATVLYDVGGHTRLLQRWVESDSTSTHCLALTEGGNVPLGVERPVNEASGSIHRLRGPARAAASRLRSLARAHALVVLHVDPNDVVSALAFGDGYAGPPVVYVNHADHVFWLLPSQVSSVISIRRSGHDLAVRARGVPPDRSLILPVPLAPAPSRGARAETRRELGLDDSAVLCVTMAAPYKYRPTAWRPSLLEPISRALSEEPNLHVIAIGPTSQDPPWKELSRAFPSRVRPLGMFVNARDVLEASDVYLDSYPFPSVTSALDAALTRVPVVTLCPRADRGTVIGLDDPALEDNAIVAETSDELAASLLHLCRRSGEREQAGAAAQRSVLDYHANPGWRVRLGECVERVRRLEPPTRRERRSEVHYDGVEQIAAIVWPQGRALLCRRIMWGESVKGIAGYDGEWRRWMVKFARRFDLSTFLYLGVERTALSP